MNSCELCAKVFESTSYLNKHLKSKSHELRRDQDTHLFKCECGRSFCQSAGLSRHRKKCSDYVTRNEPDDTIENTSENQTLRKENQEIREVITEIREEINELKSKVTKLEGKSTNNFTIVQQGRRKVNKNIRNELIIKQDNKCNDCNNVLSLYYQVDHITALQYGGNDEFDNLQALCCECHAKNLLLKM